MGINGKRENLIRTYLMDPPTETIVNRLKVKSKIKFSKYGVRTLY